MKKSWMAIGVVLIITVTGLMAMWPESKERRRQQEMENLETEVIRINLAGHYFDIPMRYMYGQAIEKNYQ
ncbi:hypothetical protein [Azomonas macrocytogenes]|uniref:Uncharacterized protein n=1 Tax=Azomonas macrocytogenes TaxID=69962 RepID=A0A839T8H2_AZOMA|nr:hypothetical protein [Azomonas macrocytogenes]MBB3105398.1 hypothetical protein [Azomonas macrocytogenes]